MRERGRRERNEETEKIMRNFWNGRDSSSTPFQVLAEMASFSVFFFSDILQQEEGVEGMSPSCDDDAS